LTADRVTLAGDFVGKYFMGQRFGVLIGGWFGQANPHTDGVTFQQTYRRLV